MSALHFHLPSPASLCAHVPACGCHGGVRRGQMIRSNMTHCLFSFLNRYLWQDNGTEQMLQRVITFKEVFDAGFFFLLLFSRTSSYQTRSMTHLLIKSHTSCLQPSRAHQTQHYKQSLTATRGWVNFDVKYDDNNCQHMTAWINSGG